MCRLLIRNHQNHLLAALLLLSQATLALESDKLQPWGYETDGNTRMRIEGDNTVIDVSENVIFTQGTLEIIGDQATIEINRTTDELSKLTVHGNPAQYQQQLNEDGGMVIGTSKTLVFYTDEIDGGSILELVDEASIKTPDTSMSCSSIIYAVDEELIREAPGPCSVEFSSPSN